MGKGRVAVVVLAVITLLLAVCAVGLIVFPSVTATVVRPISPGLAESIYPTSTSVRASDERSARAGLAEGGGNGSADGSASAAGATSSNSSASATSSASAASASATQNSASSQASAQASGKSANAYASTAYPLVARYDGVDIHSPVAPADLTAVLFHQASYHYALVMDTALPEADLEALGEDNAPRTNNAQTSGEWLDADALHLWRPDDVTPIDTSVDVGAPMGTVVRCPVSGTVVLVKDYKLFDICDDIEIHIQPTGRPDLDVVILHTYDPLVKMGDKVVGGVTEMSHVRDIAESLGGDIQLMYYTAGDDPGNHAHVQVNDVNYEGYRETKLEGAIQVA